MINIEEYKIKNILVWKAINKSKTLRRLFNVLYRIFADEAFSRCANSPTYAVEFLPGRLAVLPSQLKSS